MKYVNTKTGATINTEAILGGLWIPEKETTAPKASKKVEKVKPVKKKEKEVE